MILNSFLVITFSIILVLVWFFAKTIDRRVWVSLVITLILGPLTYFYVFYPILNIFSSFHYDKYFNAEDWKKVPAHRYEMAFNIQDDRILMNKSKEEVQKLLGKPEWFGWNDSIKANSPEQWNYNLGFKPGAFNDMQECLEIVFKNNKAVSVKQYQLEVKFE